MRDIAGYSGLYVGIGRPVVVVARSTSFCVGSCTSRRSLEQGRLAFQGYLLATGHCFPGPSLASGLALATAVASSIGAAVSPGVPPNSALLTDAFSSLRLARACGAAKRGR